MDNNLLELIRSNFFLVQEGEVIPKEISEHPYVKFLENIICDENYHIDDTDNLF